MFRKKRKAKQLKYHVSEFETISEAINYCNSKIEETNVLYVELFKLENGEYNIISNFYKKTK